MADNRTLSFFVGILALAALVIAAAATLHAAAPSQIERKCLGKMGKSAAKVAKTVLKETAKCRDSDISGKEVGACPSAPNLAKIATAKTKVVGTAAKVCRSFCSLSLDVECVDDGFCPPLASGDASEGCTQGAKDKPFSMSNVGFPGPFCEVELGGPISSPSDIGSCVGPLAQQSADDLISAVYGSITKASGIQPTAAACLKSISKAAQKLALTVVKSVAKCRNSINKGKLIGVPAQRCQFADAKTAAKIAKAETKLRKTVAAKCMLADILELDLCGNGVGGTTTVDDAADCLADAAKEVGDGGEVLPVDRVYAARSIVDAAYPPQPVCGDNVVNQLPNAFLLIGEECDGTDAVACSGGGCLPPGDAFECTCDNIPRLRFVADGVATDSDPGWTGLTFDQKVGDKSGWVTTMSNCNCSAFTGATCTGTTTDSLCDVAGFQTPFCSWDTTHSIECDTLGNGNTINEDSDCRICDDFTTNPGTSCNDENDCGSQCYDSTGSPIGPCSSQADCAGGEVCRGQCRTDVECVVIPDGAPFPVSATGAAVCSVTDFRADVVGTFDIVTGAHLLSISSFSKQFLGNLLKPCPVCGGFCVGGALDTGVCKGRCRDAGGGGSLDPCRFDSECLVVGESCSPLTDDCPGGQCQLELVCGTLPGSNNPVDNLPCEIFFEDPVFGTLSPTCEPSQVNNITGQGFPIDYQPGATTGTITVPYTIPCTATGFELYDCPCPGDAGLPSQPNSCAPACDAGVNFAQGCATASGGLATTCAGGVNAGRNCDEDGDCPASTCSDNPTHCEGDPAFDLTSCSTNGDCGLGSCVDACPGGRCLPLCVPEPGDPEDGVCAAGPPVYHCAGSLFSFLTCLEADATNGTCSAVCSGSAAPCTSINDCPSGETCDGPCSSHATCEAGNDGVLGTVDDHVGAGACFGDPDRRCDQNPVVFEGGTTLNGKGSPDDVLHVGFWCFGATNSAAVNSGSGFPGPGVIRRRGAHIISVGSIP